MAGLPILHGKLISEGAVDAILKQHIPKSHFDIQKFCIRHCDIEKWMPTFSCDCSSCVWEVTAQQCHVPVTHTWEVLVPGANLTPPLCSYKPATGCSLLNIRDKTSFLLLQLTFTTWVSQQHGQAPFPPILVTGRVLKTKKGFVTQLGSFLGCCTVQVWEYLWNRLK